MKDQQTIKGGAVCTAPASARVRSRSPLPILVLVTGAVASVLGAAGPTATSYQAVDLNPAGLTESWAYDAGGGQQVGCGCYGMASSLSVRAMLWTGSAGSAVDLHPLWPPHDFTWSSIEDTDGAQQVGWGNVYRNVGGPRPYTVNYYHGLLWTGSAASAVDLHPAGFADSWAYGVGGGQQVGEGHIRYATNKKGGSYVDQYHALLWAGSAASMVDLHPSGFTSSAAHGAGGGQQVGYGYINYYINKKRGYVSQSHALLWTGSAAGVADLHAAGFASSAAHGVNNGQQVGRGVCADGTQHALLWTGSAASVVDLHPTGFTSSGAHGVNNGQQVGYGDYADGTRHALLWKGNAASVVDLHTFLPTGFTNSEATGIDAAGNIVGHAWASGDDHHAFVWEAKVTLGVMPQGDRTRPRAQCLGVCGLPG